MIIEIPNDNSIIKWKKNEDEDWKSAEISDLIKTLEERPKGKWLKFGVVGLKACYKCSICGRYAVDNVENNIAESCPFCHCGADMRKGGAK